MSEPVWYLDPEVPEHEAEAGENAPALVTLHYLSGAVRRNWIVCATTAVVGALLGMAFAVLVPAGSNGTVTLMLSHEAGTDPAVGMATDVSLLRTRAVAVATIEELDLTMSPEDLHRSVTVEPSTPAVLVLTISGTDDDDAVERARVLAENFLEFRSQQLMSRAEAMANGYQEQVDVLQRQVDDLTVRYEALTASGPSGGREAAAVLTERSQRASEIVRLQQAIEDTTLRASAVVAASHVLDPASAVPQGAKRRAFLAIASGLVGGGALGLAAVLFVAVTTGRLRRRGEIGLALGVPVRASVARLQPPRLWRGAPGASRALGMQVLLHVLDALAESDEALVRRMGLVATSRTSDAELLVASLAARLAQRGRSVFVADLSTEGCVAGRIHDEVERLGAEAAANLPHVFRPEGHPQLARGPLHTPDGASDLRPGGAHRQAYDEADVVLAVADVDPALEADALATWVDSVVYVVRAGRSSAERLRSVAQLVAQAGLRQECALLVGSDHSDESIGIPAPEGASGPGSGNRR